jgi:hypothetical protein
LNGGRAQRAILLILTDQTRKQWYRICVNNSYGFVTDERSVFDGVAMKSKKNQFIVGSLILFVSVGCNLSERFMGASDGVENSAKAESRKTPPVETEEPSDLPAEKPKSAIDVPGNTPSPGKELRYKLYGNSRFGYSVEYPAELLIPQGEAPNGDGQIFRNDEAEMRVYGSNLLLNETLQAEYESLLKEKKGVTYKVVKKDFFVISGKDKGRIYYQKMMHGENDDFLIFMIEYPETKRAIYDEVVTRIVKSFKN